MISYRSGWIFGAAASLLFVSSALCQPAPAARPAIPRSPEIHPDKTVTFRLSAPKAAEVTLNGSWDGASSIKMDKNDEGIWSGPVGPLREQGWRNIYQVDGANAHPPGDNQSERDGYRSKNQLII